MTPDEAMTKLAERIERRISTEAILDDPDARWVDVLKAKAIIAAELVPLRRVVGAVQRYDDNPNWNNGKKVREALTSFLRTGAEEKQDANVG